MKFICKIAPLSEAITAATKVINTHTTIPILNNILIDTDDGVVIIRSTDLETTYEKRVPAAVTEKGSTTVPAHIVAKYLSELIGDEVAISALNNPHETAGLVLFTCGKSRIEVNRLPANMYPQLPNGENNLLRGIEGQEIARALLKVLFTAGNEDASPVRGLRLDLSLNGVRTTATDGYRLARHDNNAGNDTTSVVLTLNGAKILAKAIDKSPQVNISLIGVDANHLLLDDGCTRVYTRLISTPYPDVERALDNPGQNILIINRENLRLALKRAALLADNQTKSIQVTIDNNDFHIFVSSALHGNGREIVEIEHQGENFQLYTHAAFLAQILDQIESEKVRIYIGSPQTPIHIFPNEDQPKERYLLMPLRPQ